MSEEFLKLLTPEESRTLEFQPVIAKGHRAFFELVGPDGPPEIAVSDLKLGGWRCGHCDYKRWGYWIKGMAISCFIPKSDLKTPLSGLFTVGVSPEVHIAATATRWKGLVGRKGTHGFKSHLLGVVPDIEVVRSPVLRTAEEQLREKYENSLEEYPT